MTGDFILPPILKKEPMRTLTVGAPGCDVVGFEGKHVQLAIDALSATGGRVILSAGEFAVAAPIRMCSGLTLEGAGCESTVLKKKAAFRSPIARDADYGELVVTVADASGFAVGDGVVIYDSPNEGAWGPTATEITEIRGNVLYLRDYLERDYSAVQNGVVSNACSVIEAVKAQNVTVKNLTVDGTDGQSEILSSCRGGGVYFYQSRDMRAENVTVRNFGGDGFSVQMMENVALENCAAIGCTYNGIHPGAGSYGVKVLGCTSTKNGGDGLYVCWRVIGAEFKNNRLFDNRQSGINIGHKDTDNLFENNICTQNDKYGLHLRQERADNSPHRCTYRGNDFRLNKLGSVRISSPAEGLIFEGNQGYGESEE